MNDPIGAYMADEIGNYDITEAVTQLRDLRKIFADLRVIESELVNHISKIALTRNFVIDGVGAIEIKTASKRTAYDHERLLSLVAARCADERVDRETGEVVPPAVFADLVARKVAEAAAISYWRKGKLAEMHIPLDDYCTVEYGGPGVIIR